MRAESMMLSLGLALLVPIAALASCSHDMMARQAAELAPPPAEHFKSLCPQYEQYDADEIRDLLNELRADSAVSASPAVNKAIHDYFRLLAELEKRCGDDAA